MQNGHAAAGLERPSACGRPLPPQLRNTRARGSFFATAFKHHAPPPHLTTTTLSTAQPPMALCTAKSLAPCQRARLHRDTGKQENHVLQSTVLSLQANLANLQEHDELQQISLGHLQDELRSVRDNSGALTVLVEQSKLMHSALQSRFDALQSTSHRQWDAIVLLARGWLWLGNQVKELRAQRTQFVHYAHTLYNALQAAAAEMRHIVPEPGQALLVKPLRSVALAVVAANRLRRLRRGAPGGHEQAVCTLTGGQRLGLAPESSVMACGLPDEAGAVEGPDGIAALTHLLTHLCSANALLDLSAMHTGPGPFRAGASRLPRSMTVALHLKAAATSVQHRLQSAEADAATHQRKHRALLEDCERHRAQLESLETVHTNRVRALEEAVQSKADLVRELERQEAAQRQRSEELQEALGAAEAELRGQTEALDKAVQARKGQTEQVDRLTKRLEGAQQVPMKLGCLRGTSLPLLKVHTPIKYGHCKMVPQGLVLPGN